MQARVLVLAGESKKEGVCGLGVSLHVIVSVSFLHEVAIGC